MPIRPIDILRTQEATQIKHTEIQRTQHAQEHQSRSFQTTIKQEKYKPTQTTNAEYNEYRYDAKEKGNNMYKKEDNKKQKKEQEEEKNPKAPSKNGNFDILI